MSKIVVFGGSFNPLSKAHVGIIRSTIRNLKPSEVIIVPTSDTFIHEWKKFQTEFIIPLRVRLEILKEFVSRNKNISICTCEIDGVTSKTFDTLSLIQKNHQNDTIYFLSGTDKVKEFEKWYRAEDILKNFNVIFIERNGDFACKMIKENHFYDNYRDHVSYIINRTKQSYISSSKIRESLAQKNYKALSELTFVYVLKILAKEGIL